jgi:hypothetical protein
VNNRSGHSSSAGRLAEPQVGAVPFGRRRKAAHKTGSYVSGPQSEGYTFTSSLPLAALKLLAPTLSAAARDELAPPGPAREPCVDGARRTG